MRTVALMALMLVGCGPRLSSEVVADYAGAIADVRAARAAKDQSDASQRGNLRAAWLALAKLEAELAIVSATTDGQVPVQVARETLTQMHTDLSAAATKLDEIQAAQRTADQHYESAIQLMTAALGLLRALVDRGEAEAAGQVQAVGAARAAGAAARRAITGGVTP